jgi:two-component system, cell cycle response regulator
MGVTILTVDDSKLIRTLVGRALKPYDVRLLEAENGVEALEVARAERPDMILLDVAMPVMDGIRTLEALKDDPALKPIPVIMLTAEAGRERVLDIIRGGANYYLLKPFDPETLVSSIVKKLTLLPRRNLARKYFAVENGVGIATMPATVNPAMLTEILPELSGELARIRAAGSNGLVVDLEAIERVTVPVVQLVAELAKRCAEAKMSMSVCGGPEQARGLGMFEEARDVPVHFGMGKARAALAEREDTPRRPPD